MSSLKFPTIVDELSEWLPGKPCFVCGGKLTHRLPHIPGLKLLVGCVWSSPYSIMLQTPVVQVCYYRGERKLSLEVKLGKCWHDLIWDAKHQPSLIQHIKQHW